MPVCLCITVQFVSLLSFLVLFCLYTEQYIIIREPTIGLIKWLRPKGLKGYSYVEKCAEFKNQTLIKLGWYTKKLWATGVGNISE